jgi:hypothetical protein
MEQTNQLLGNPASVELCTDSTALIFPKQIVSDDGSFIFCKHEEA